MTTTTMYLVDDRNRTGYAQVLEEFAPEPASVGLVGRWRMDEPSGTTTWDDGAAAHTATLWNGTTRGAGVSGRGLRFDGVDDHATVDDAADLRLNTMTIAFWVKKDSEAADYVRYVGKGAGTQRNYGVWDEIGSGKLVLFQVYSTSGAALNVFSTVGLEVGRWYHVACSYDGSMGRVYVNGNLAGQGSAAFVPATTSDNLSFGYGGIHSYLPGSLDDVRIYNRALGAPDIAALAQPPVTYAYGLDIISQTRAGATSFYGCDGHGSVRFLTDGTMGSATYSQVTDTCTYDAFGIQIGSWSLNSQQPTLNSYRYTGEQWDPDLGMYYLRARYYHPDLGRFWTMDSFEGSQTDPSSLHGYLYGAANPANNIDPSGKSFTSVIEFGLASTFAVGSKGQWEAARTPVYAAGLARANAIAQILAATYAGYLAADLVAERTGLGEYLDRAKEEFKARFKDQKLPKIVPMPASVIPKVAAHIATHQAANPSSMMLTRASLGQNVINRARVMRGRGSADPGMGWDEYPFASSREGGNPAAVTIVPVPRRENLVQGGIIMGSYIVENIQPGDKFAVVVIP